MTVFCTRRIGQQVATTIILVVFIASGVLAMEPWKQNPSYRPDTEFGIHDKTAAGLPTARELERLIPI